MGKRWTALILAVIPGMGHLYLGRHWRGLLVFSLFALGANGMYLAGEISESEWNPLAQREVAIYVYHLCRGVAAAAWAYSILHIAYLGKRLATKPAQERRDYHLKRGLVQYVSGAFEGAKAEFLTVLRLDPMDIDARFHLAMTHQALGQHRRALKTFKRCLADDVDAKWAWEIQTQIDKVRQGK